MKIQLYGYIYKKTKKDKMRKTNMILIVSLVFNLLASVYVAKRLYLKYLKTQVVQVEVVPTKKPKITYFLNRNELFDNLPVEKNSIVFLGNSLTQNFELAELFHNLKIKNRGINSDVIVGVINRLDPIIKANPSKIFIEIGINDLATGYTKDSVIYNYKKLIDIIKIKLPRTELYVHSIFPTEKTSDIFPTYCNKEINFNVVEVNKVLLKYASIRNYYFIDTYKTFEKEGYLNRQYSVDGVHLNSEGYKLWVKILKPYLE